MIIFVKKLTPIMMPLNLSGGNFGCLISSGEDVHIPSGPKRQAKIFRLLTRLICPTKKSIIAKIQLINGNYSGEVQLFVCLTKFEAINHDFIKDISKLAKS